MLDCPPLSLLPQTDASGAKLKNLVIDQGVVQLCIDYISKHVPNKE